jgi:hypothetical protein
MVYLSFLFCLGTWTRMVRGEKEKGWRKGVDGLIVCSVPMLPA